MNAVKSLFNKLNGSDKIISGVCSGISAYLSAKMITVPAILLRILFILLLTFVSAIPTVLLYIAVGVFINRLSSGRESEGDETAE